MTFEELQIEELNHIISDLKQQLNYELHKNTMLNKQLDALVALGDKISHQNEEQQETIDDLQTELKYRINEIKSICTDRQQLHKEINHLKEVIKNNDDVRIELIEVNNNLTRCLTLVRNDYKKCYAENIRLAKENNKLKIGEYNEFRKMISDLWKGVDE